MNCFATKYTLRAIFILVSIAMLNFKASAQTEIIRQFKKSDTINISSKGLDTYWIRELTCLPNYEPKSYFPADSTRHSSGRITRMTDLKHSTYIRYNTKNLVVYLEGSKRETWFYVTNQTAHRINLETGLSVGNAYIGGFFKTVTLLNGLGGGTPVLDNYYVEALDADTLKCINPVSLTVVNSYTKCLIYNNWNNSRLWINDSKIDSLCIGGNLPVQLVLYNVDFSGVKGQVDLTKFNTTKKTTLFLKNVDIKKLNINLTHTLVTPVADQSYENRLATLQELVKRCNDLGYTGQAEEYDKALQSLKYKFNGEEYKDIISKYWWDYGYDKSRVIFISIGVFFFFSLLNFTIANRMKEVYWPERFQEFDARLNAQYVEQHRRNRVKKHFKHTLGIFLFTAFVFWGVRFDLKEMEIRHRGIVLLLVTEYVVGVICLAYIANFVISK